MHEEQMLKAVRPALLTPHCIPPHPTLQVRNTLIVNGRLNADVVGQSAVRLADLFGLKVPEWTRVIIGEVRRFSVMHGTMYGRQLVHTAGCLVNEDPCYLQACLVLACTNLPPLPVPPLLLYNSRTVCSALRWRALARMSR